MTSPSAQPYPSGGSFRLDAQWVVPIEPANTTLEWHSVVVKDGRVLDVLPTSEAQDAYQTVAAIDLRGQVLLPGLINGHTHAAMTLLRGLADDMTLMDWLRTRIWPAEAQFVSAEFVADGTSLACLEMVLGGITTFNDMYFYPQDAIRSAVEVGIRIQAGITYLDTPTAYARSEAEYLERGLDARAAWRDHPLATFSLAPHATYTTSPQSLARLPRLAAELDLPIHTHLHETQAEVEREIAGHGRTGVGRLAAAGALGPRFAGAHGVHMNVVDVDDMIAADASIVHCPSSNMKLASGFAPAAAMLAAGMNVALGTDGAASNNRLDMWQEMRMAALLAKGVSGNAAALSAFDTLRMATLGGAKALGLADRLGSITPGKLADLVAVDLTGPQTQPCYDPISHLVYVVGRQNVSHVWVGGRHVVAEGECLTIDPAEVLGRADEWQDQLQELPG